MKRKTTYCKSALHMKIQSTSGILNAGHLKLRYLEPLLTLTIIMVLYVRNPYFSVTSENIQAFEYWNEKGLMWKTESWHLLKLNYFQCFFSMAFTFQIYKIAYYLQLQVIHKKGQQWSRESVPGVDVGKTHTLTKR